MANKMWWEKSIEEVREDEAYYEKYGDSFLGYVLTTLDMICFVSVLATVISFFFASDVFFGWAVALAILFSVRWLLSKIF